MSDSFSQLFVLSARGDVIIYRDFRHDIVNSKTCPEIFFRNCKFFYVKGKQSRDEAPPVFNIDGINYLYIKKNGLFFVLTSRENVSPSLGIELLIRLTKLFKDYCGVLTEESIRTNFTLIYELLDEIIDFGYVQGTNAEQVKAFVYNDAILLKATGKDAGAVSGGNGSGGGINLKFPDMNPKTTPSTSVDKPIAYKEKAGQKKKNEIFVDIFERISITFNANGYVLNSSVDGTIQMKSYLAGNPELRLALNEELVIGKTGNAPTYGVVELDDCNFHECVQLNDFDSSRILSFVPPDGEFVLMNYRVTGDRFRAPFRIFPFFELTSPYKVELIIKVRADIPQHNYGGNVVLTIPMPKATSSVVCDTGQGTGGSGGGAAASGGAGGVMAGQSTEYDAKERKVNWRIKKMNGGSEHTLKCRITLSAAHNHAVRKEIGPIAMLFEIPMFNPSGLQVRYLRILENKSYNPYRWVRYVTRSQSYICRL